MGALDGRVAIITGAGRGVGREHALLFASEGAKVVVNNRTGASDATRPELGLAHDVVDEIRAAGGEAIPNTDDVADWDGAKRLIQTALDAYGDLHVLVNNAGILRDRMLVNMSPEEWDEVMHVNLRGHFCPTRWAAEHWRDQSKAGREVKASIVNTASGSGLWGNPGQANYGASKGGVASLTMISQMELERYGVRCNAISPSARTRMTLPGLSQRPDETVGDFDIRDPANISPFVAYLATENCPIKGKVFFVRAGEIHLFQPWTLVDHIAVDRRWTLADLEREAIRFASVDFDTGSWLIREPPFTS
jgi:NAD(P)-dependent dehydrogenase (short-subunit alcohol dehydrogenase family)